MVTDDGNNVGGGGEGGEGRLRHVLVAIKVVVLVKDVAVIVVLVAKVDKEVFVNEDQMIQIIQENSIVIQAVKKRNFCIYFFVFVFF